MITEFGKYKLEIVRTEGNLTDITITDFTTNNYWALTVQTHKIPKCEKDIIDTLEFMYN